MNAKRFSALALVLVLVAGCGAGKFAEEKTLLTTVTKAMEAFNGAIGSAGVPEDVAKALGSLTGALETVLPKMKELNTAHPDWEDNPPEALKSTFDKFEAASNAFKTESLPKVMKFAQENADNVDLQAALKKFSSIASQM
jgi:hypothetical protein